MTREEQMDDAVNQAGGVISALQGAGVILNPEQEKIVVVGFACALVPDITAEEIRTGVEQAPEDLDIKPWVKLGHVTRRLKIRPSTK